MKKNILYTVLGLFVVVILQSFGSQKLGKKDGTEPGYTGSPGDSLKNCTACHGGNAVDVYDWITSDIPANGYIPGKTYTITAINIEAGATRFGFLVSPQNLRGDLLGELIITDTTTTKLVGNNKYITYKAAGVEGVDSKSWSFKWVAPDVDTVVFYGAFNSNFDGHKAGDRTFLTQLMVQKANSSGLNSLNRSQSINLYPCPTSNYFTFDIPAGVGLTQVRVIENTGKEVLNAVNPLANKIEVGHLPNGLYQVFISNGQTNYTAKLIKQ